MHDAHDKEKSGRKSTLRFCTIQLWISCRKIENFSFKCAKTREENEQCGANFDLEINCRKLHFQSNFRWVLWCSIGRWSIFVQRWAFNWNIKWFNGWLKVSIICEPAKFHGRCSWISAFKHRAVDPTYRLTDDGYFEECILRVYSMSIQLR